MELSESYSETNIAFSYLSPACSKLHYALTSGFSLTTALLSPIQVLHALNFPYKTSEPKTLPRKQQPTSAFFFSMESCDFSSDIIYEILTRSSMETVGRCRLLSKECNGVTYDSVFTDLHGRRTSTMSGYFMQSMMSNRFYSSFVSMDDWRSYPKLSLNFLPDRVEIQASTNQGIVLCQTIHPRYYVCKPTTQQWRKIPNPKTRYHTLATGMIVVRSNPLHYKIVRFSQPRFRCHDKEFYRYWWVRCELFDSKAWTWKQLDEVKLPNHESFSHKPAVSVSGSLHWLTYVENNIFAFHVDKESYSMFSLPLSDSEDDKGKDIELVEYMGKLAITCIGKDESSMELWVMENYGKKEWSKRYKINIEAFRMEPYTSPVAFYNADIVLMKEHDHRVTFLNFKNGSIERLSLENKLNHGSFRFQSDFEPSDLTGGFALKHPQGERRRSKSNRRKPSVFSVSF